MKAEKRQAEQTNFLLYKEQLENWIKEKSNMVKDHNELANEATLRTNMETLNVIYNRLPEGQSLYVIVKDAFEKSKHIMSAPDLLNIEGDMEKLQAHWDQLETDVNEALVKMKAALVKLETYQENKQKFDRWLTEKEDQLSNVFDNRGDLGEMKTVVERYRSHKQEILLRKPDLEQLMHDGDEISKWPQNEKEVQSLKSFESRYNLLDSKCDDMIKKVQAEIEDFVEYNQLLQETEKWLLQVSFQLMAHNSLFINNKETTQEQLAQHEILLTDIQKYQINIDDLRSRGQGQISKYEHCNPYIRTTIETHLKNVQDSYDSLLKTSVQIKSRLEDSLAKFQEYEDTLDDLDRKLTLYQEEVPSPDDERPNQLGVCLEDLERAKAISSSLQKEKQRLAAAVQACEAATASISRPSSPIEMAMQPIPEKELRVRAQLDDLSDNVSEIEELHTNHLIYNLPSAHFHNPGSNMDGRSVPQRKGSGVTEAPTRRNRRLDRQATTCCR